MTREELHALPAGPELDALIAKAVFGYEFLEVGYWKSRLNGVEQLPESATAERQLQLRDWMRQPEIVEATDNSIGEYWIKEAENLILRVQDFTPSASMGQVWPVVEWLKARGYALSLHDNENKYAPCWDARFVGELTRGMSIAESAPLAICRAALIAMPS